jgi:hypothetical protein
VPDANGGALDVILSAELAHVAGVLCDLTSIVSGCPAHEKAFGYAHLHLLNLLAERSTVTGTVLSGDADLLCACIAVRKLLDSGSGESYVWSYLRLYRGYLMGDWDFDNVKSQPFKIGLVGSNPPVSL